MDPMQIQSTNANSLWIENIMSNIKKIEELQTLASQGCDSILSYIQITPQERQVMIGDVMFKNLRFIIEQLERLLEDIDLVMQDTEKRKKYLKIIHDIDDRLENDRALFIKEGRNADRTIKYSQVTPFFTQTLRFVSQLKVDILNDIRHILFFERNEANTQI